MMQSSSLGQDGDREPQSASLSPMNKNKRKKHLRRTATEIDRTYICPYDGCTKFFGSEGS